MGDRWLDGEDGQRKREGTERVQLVASVLYNTHKQMDTHTKQMDTGIQTETHTHTHSHGHTADDSGKINTQCSDEHKVTQMITGQMNGHTHTHTHICCCCPPTTAFIHFIFDQTQDASRSETITGLIHTHGMKTFQQRWRKT